MSHLQMGLWILAADSPEKVPLIGILRPARLAAAIDCVSGIAADFDVVILAGDHLHSADPDQWRRRSPVSTFAIFRPIDRCAKSTLLGKSFKAAGFLAP